MSRQTRLILLLSGIALVALIALSVMAQRYSSLLKSEGAQTEEREGGQT